MAPSDNATSTTLSDPSMIFQATEACRIRLQECRTVETLTKDRWAENCLVDFNAWDVGVGASAREHMSLDMRLQRDPTTRKAVIRILNTLAALIAKCKDLGHEISASETPTTGVRGTPAVETATERERKSPVSERTSSSETRSRACTPEIELSEAQSGIKKLLWSLGKIETSIKQADGTSRYRSADRSFESTKSTYDKLRQHLEFLLLIPQRRSSDGTSRLREFHDDHDAVTPEQTLLINANLRRHHRIIYVREQEKKLRTPMHTLVEDSHQSQVEAENNASGEGNMGNLRNNPLLSISTSLSDAQKYPGGRLYDRESEQGSKVITIALDTDYPQPPKMAAGTPHFPCPYCQLNLPTKFTLQSEENLWRKHVSEDLQPYTCPVPDCLSGDFFYSTLDAWKTHMRHNHSSQSSWICFVCEKPFDEQTVFISHMKDEHHDMKSEESLEVLVEACERPDDPAFDSCPICSTTEKAWTYSRDCSRKETSQQRSEKQTTIPFLDHIGECLHGFSLRSLPWDDNHVESVDSLRVILGDSDRVTDGLASPSSNQISGVMQEDKRELTTPVLHQISYDPDGYLKICKSWLESSGQPARPRRTPRLLLVEDNAVYLKLLQRFMIREDYPDVTAASNGKIAVEEFTKAVESGGWFDIIFMDLVMPVMGGLDATRAIREIERQQFLTAQSPQLPSSDKSPTPQANIHKPATIIAMTAAGAYGDESRIYCHGADYVIHKPVRFGRLMELFDNWQDGELRRGGRDASATVHKSDVGKGPTKAVC